MKDYKKYAGLLDNVSSLFYDSISWVLFCRISAKYVLLWNIKIKSKRSFRTNIIS